MSSPSEVYRSGMLPRIAFVTTCRGRLAHLRETLIKNVRDNLDYPNCIFVVVSYGDTSELDDYIRQLNPLILSGNLAYYQFPEAERFEMAKAKNVAHRCGLLEGADILVNLDADNFTTPGFAQYIAEQFDRPKEERIFLWSRMIQGQFRRGISGRIAMTANAFLEIGGYDEKYCDWGPDDKNANLRLQRLGYTPVEIEARFLDALSHNDKLRFKEYKHAAANKADYFSMTLESCDETVANFGQVGCGRVYRNFDRDHIDLEALPTRVWGIGLQKTASTSLHLAMEMLGFSSAHWLSAKWAKTVWREMTSTGKSPTLERHYHACDLPIPMLMRKLDVAYPGSKFILTVTDEEAWIKAVELHWDPTHNPYRSGWDNDCFTNRVHSILYGKPEFDREVMLARYRHHNADVLSYFKDRPGDLLVLEMSKLDSRECWEKLCAFLGKPVPSKPYPHGNSDAALALNKHWLHCGDL